MASSQLYELPWTALAGAGGTGASFAYPAGSGLVVASTVTTVAGDSPALTVFLDVEDSAKGWVQAGVLPAQIGAGTVYGDFSPGLAAPSQTGTARLRWALAGTSPQMGAALTVSRR